MRTERSHRNRRVSCTTVARHLQKELGGRLKSAAYRNIRAHVRTCPNCSAYLDSLRKIVRMYQKAPCPQLPANVRNGLFRALRLRGSIH